MLSTWNAGVMLPDRIQDKIMPVVDGCWLWNGGLSTSGYGTVYHNGRTRRAHRVIWEMRVGEVPGGLEFDHLCRVRCCVNPDHLELVTRSENIRRDTNHCSEHTDRMKDGRCRVCRNDWRRAWMKAKKRGER